MSLMPIEYQQNHNKYSLLRTTTTITITTRPNKQRDIIFNDSNEASFRPLRQVKGILSKISTKNIDGELPCNNRKQPLMLQGGFPQRRRMDLPRLKSHAGPRPIGGLVEVHYSTCLRGTLPKAWEPPDEILPEMEALFSTCLPEILPGAMEPRGETLQEMQAP